VYASTATALHPAVRLEHFLHQHDVFAGSPVIEGPLSKHIPVDVYVPGCPPHPDAIIEGIARAAEILASRGVSAKAKGEPQR